MRLKKKRVLIFEMAKGLPQKQIQANGNQIWKQRGLLLIIANFKAKNLLIRFLDKPVNSNVAEIGERAGPRCFRRVTH